MVENKIFLKLRMFSDHSCVNRTQKVHGTSLHFLFLLSPIVWNMCEKLHYESVSSKESSTQRPRILLTDKIQGRVSCSVNYY